MLLGLLLCILGIGDAPLECDHSPGISIVVPYLSFTKPEQKLNVPTKHAQVPIFLHASEAEEADAAAAFQAAPLVLRKALLSHPEVLATSTAELLAELTSLLREAYPAFRQQS